MIIYIGNCPKCGGKVFWSVDHHMCSFNSVDECLCKCPYPRNFMQEWSATPTNNIEDDYQKWLESNSEFKNEPEFPFYSIPGRYLIINKSFSIEYVFKMETGCIKFILRDLIIEQIYPYNPTDKELLFLNRL